MSRSPERIFFSVKTLIFFPLLKIVSPSQSTNTRTVVIRSFSCNQLAAKPYPFLADHILLTLSFLAQKPEGTKNHCTSYSSFRDVGKANRNVYPKTKFQAINRHFSVTKLELKLGVGGGGGKPFSFAKAIIFFTYILESNEILSSIRALFSHQ